MPLPMPFASLWVFVPRRILPRETINENVRPPILIEIVGKREKIIGIGIVRPEAAFKPWNNLFGAIALLVFEGRVSRIKLMTLFKIRPFIPIGARYHVCFPV